MAHPSGLTWGAYLGWVVSEAGSLAAAAERLSARHGHRDDAQSIERALRRLRTREQGDGGKWGMRLLQVFGLPGAIRERARWLGAYHSRFTDLPVPVCEDLVRLWDQAPLNQERGARVWLSLAHASCALRRHEAARADEHLAAARAAGVSAPPDARVELLLVEAFLASRQEGARADELLERVGPLLAECEGMDAQCLRVRWVDQRAYQLNRQQPGASAQVAEAEALYRAVPTEGAPPFVLARRASGLAYARHRLGDDEGAVELAREACRQAGDGGHVRLRAMALAMLARVGRGDEAAEAHRRATAIAAMLDDETLRLRFGRLRRG